MKRKLIIFTRDFPFGIGEAAFLIPELAALEKTFAISIICKNITSKQTTSISSNISIYRCSGKTKVNLMLLFRVLTNGYFWREIVSVGVKKRQLLLEICKEVLSAEQFYAFMKNNKLLFNDGTIYYSYWYDQSVLAMAMHKKQIKKSKLITRIHRADLYKNQVFRKQVDQYVDNIIFISRAGMEYYLKANNQKYEQEKHRLFYLGSDSQYPINHRKSDEVLRIFSCSFLSPVKRIDKIIDVIEKIDYPNVQWRHIGDGILKKEIESYAEKKLSSKNNISYEFLGYQENEVVKKHMHEDNIDIFINLSESEGLPVTFMEAMSQGIPVVTNNVGGVSEIVNNKNGILVEKDTSPDEIAQIIIMYKLHEDEQRQKRQAAYNTWKENYNATDNYRKFAQFLIQL
ncbi:glycosyltransferase [Hungatella hathewayi]